MAGAKLLDRESVEVEVCGALGRKAGDSKEGETEKRQDFWTGVMQKAMVQKEV